MRGAVSNRNGSGAMVIREPRRTASRMRNRPTAEFGEVGHRRVALRALAAGRLLSSDSQGRRTTKDISLRVYSVICLYCLTYYLLLRQRVPYWSQF